MLSLRLQLVGSVVAAAARAAAARSGAALREGRGAGAMFVPALPSEHAETVRAQAA